MTPQADKGAALERAVDLIESWILQLSPSSRGAKFTTETRKVIVVEGVRHEIDVWVEVALAPGYKSVFIFECKNRKSKANKNDIVAFAEKINAAQAQQGFFVAKSLTRYATAQARRHPRITIYKAEDLPIDDLRVPFDFQLTDIEKRHSIVDFRLDTESLPEQCPGIDAPAQLSGETLDLREYIDEWTSEVIRSRLDELAPPGSPEGRHHIRVNTLRRFSAGDLTVAGYRVAAILLDVEATVRVVRPAVVSHIGVETRGRAISFAPVELAGLTVTPFLTAVQLPQDS